MELKMKYHYSYFIYPYIIKREKYNKYLQRLLKNKKCTPRFFEKRKNFSMYNYFLPTVRDYMFRSFGFADANEKVFSSASLSLKANMLGSNPCSIFDININEDIQAKAEGEDRNIF